jgi:hypothetical protein
VAVIKGLYHAQVQDVVVLLPMPVVVDGIIVDKIAVVARLLNSNSNSSTGDNRLRIIMIDVEEESIILIIVVLVDSKAEEDVGRLGTDHPWIEIAEDRHRRRIILRQDGRLWLVGHTLIMTCPSSLLLLVGQRDLIHFIMLLFLNVCASYPSDAS